MIKRGAAAQLILVLVILLAAVLIGKGLSTGNLTALFIPLAAVVLFLSLTSPWLSLLAFLLLFLQFRSSADITPMKLGTLGYMVLLFLLSFASFLRERRWDRTARYTTTLIFAFLAYLGLSLGIARVGGVSFSDWGRDVFPLAALCAAAIFVTTLRTQRQWTLTAIALLVVVVNMGASAAGNLGGRLGDWVLVPALAQWDSTLIPAALIAIGAAMLLQGRRVNWPYVGVLALGLLTAVLTPTRTVWISAALTLLVLLAVSVGRFRRWSAALGLLLLAGGFVGATLLLWQNSGPDTSWGEQTGRFSTLQNLNEDQSVTIRRDQLNEALRLFRSSPIIGVGLGYQYRYSISFTDRYDVPTNYNHSDLANSLAKMGVLGTALIYALLVFAILAAVRLQRVGVLPQDRALGMAAEAALIVAIVIGNSTPMLQEKGSAFLLSLLVGLVLARLNLLQAARAVRPEELMLQGETAPGEPGPPVAVNEAATLPGTGGDPYP
ncbi:MAG TPA: O-antigen ligase family protein [Armatimonadota bacterium]|jgi:O-antigen ligase